MKEERDNAAIYDIIAEEERSWIPEEGVAHFHFKWSSSRDTDWWYFKWDNHDYLYLDREWWYHVTVQRAHWWNNSDNKISYWNVYIEKEITDEDSVRANQSLCHTFRWVRSLRHALYLWEVSNEIALRVAYPANFFLTKEEWEARY